MMFIYTNMMTRTLPAEPEMRLDQIQVKTALQVFNVNFQGTYLSIPSQEKAKQLNLFRRCRFRRRVQRLKSYVCALSRVSFQVSF